VSEAQMTAVSSIRLPADVPFAKYEEVFAA
jgi:hypothetical protein